MVSTAGFPCVYDNFAEPRLISGPHIYPGTIAVGGGYTFPRSLLQDHFDMRQNESIRLALPLLVGETGLASGAANAGRYAHDFADMAEHRLANWAWWAFGYDDTSMGLCDAAGNPKELFYHELARPYPRVTAGVLREFHFDVDAAIFTVTFDTADAAPAAEIWLNKSYWFPSGFAVQSSDPDGAWSQTYDAASDTLTIQADPGSPSHVFVVAASAS